MSEETPDKPPKKEPDPFDYPLYNRKAWIRSAETFPYVRGPLRTLVASTFLAGGLMVPTVLRPLQTERMHAAIREKNPDALRANLYEGDVNEGYQDEAMWAPPLLQAIRYSNPEAMKILLQKGAKTDCGMLNDAIEAYHGVTSAGTDYAHIFKQGDKQDALKCLKILCEHLTKDTAHSADYKKALQNSMLVAEHLSEAFGKGDKAVIDVLKQQQAILQETPDVDHTNNIKKSPTSRSR